MEWRAARGRASWCARKPRAGVSRARRGRRSAVRCCGIEVGLHRSRTRCEIRQQERPQWTHLRQPDGGEGPGSGHRNPDDGDMARSGTTSHHIPAAHCGDKEGKPRHLAPGGSAIGASRWAAWHGWEVSLFSIVPYHHVAIAAALGGGECRPPSSTARCGVRPCRRDVPPRWRAA